MSLNHLKSKYRLVPNIRHKPACICWVTEKNAQPVEANMLGSLERCLTIAVLLALGRSRHDYTWILY